MRRALKVAICTMALLSAAAGAALAADEVIYRQTFELDNGGFTFTGPWSWGAVTLSTGQGAPEGAYSGDKCIGTGLAAKATDGGTAVSPDIAIPTLGTGQFAVISYYAFTDIGMTDRGRFFISDDGGTTWHRIANHYMYETIFTPDNFYPEGPDGDYPNLWRKYSYDISAYSGKDIQLKYELVSGQSMPGYYLDDITVTVSTVGSVNKVTLSMEAAEDPDGSCPWVFTWDGGKYVQDNDIYSVARYPQGEYRDYYLLQKPLAARDGSYQLQVKEVDDEISWSDYVGLRAVDHAADVAVGVDNSGNVHAYKPAQLLAPVNAFSATGADVTALVATNNGEGAAAYSQDYIDVDFGVVSASEAKNLVLRVKGFNVGKEKKMPFTGPPAVVVKVFQGGAWVEKGRLLPRFDWSENVFDLSSVAPDADGHTRVRIESVSHGAKYHEIDSVGLFAGTEPAFEIHELALTAANGNKGDVLSAVSSSDNVYNKMETADWFDLTFNAAEATGAARDFIFVSEGYYIPSNTIYVYTWNGSEWVLRDGRSFINVEDPFTDLAFDIDLSMYLPDPDGEYKVRLWNNFAAYEGRAYLDYVGMSVKPPSSGEIAGAIETAKDLRYPNNETLSAALITRIQAADGVDALDLDPFASYYEMGLTDNDFEGSYDPWDEEYNRPRSNWIEVQFSNLPANRPPVVANITLRRNRVTWTIEDADEGDAQQFFAAEIWTQPGGNGDIVWNPPTFNSASGSLTLPDGLVTGETYYLRVRASDGTTWGNWTEYEFVMPALDFKLYDEKVNIGCFIDTLQR